MSSMALSKIAFSFIIIFAAFNLATLSPNVNNVFAQLCNILRSWMPSVTDSVEEIILRMHKYCTERLFEDLQRGITMLITLFERVCALIQPAFKNLFNVVTDGLLLLHNNGMSYTDEILQQALGIDGAALPDHGGTTSNKLLSLILFLFWIILALVCISRLSYNKFFLLMSSTFLLHAFLGPVWCIRRLAFGIGTSLWLGSLISSKPIPAAITVLIAFTLTGFRKWRKEIAITNNTKDMLKLSELLEQRLHGIEEKLDVLVLKISAINDTLPENVTFDRS
ncbi:uncharacterized protein [Montipora foliosa]|uniref:uncharacterized protein isoform X1 n=1 Tax=Montipora foliosa TaxID=591990 RepID=UPI0035F10FB8